MPAAFERLVIAELEVVVGGHDQVLAVLVGARALVEGEERPHRHAAGVGHAAGDLELRAELVDTDRRVLLAIGLLHVFAGVVEDLVVARLVLARLRLLGLQIDARPLEVVVLVHVHARLNLARELPAADVLELRPYQLLWCGVWDLLVAGTGHMLAARVGQHQRVVPVGVPEVVVDAFVLHQPADEVEVAFPVLHAVGPRPVAARQLEREVGRRVVGEHLLDDVRHRHLLEDAAVSRARQEPQPGMHGGLVRVIAAVQLALREARDEAVEVARAVVGQRQLDRDVLAEDRIPVDLAVRAQQIQVVLAQAAQFLAAVHAVEQQDALAKRRGDVHDAVHQPRHGVLRTFRRSSYTRLHTSQP